MAANKLKLLINKSTYIISLVVSISAYNTRWADMCINKLYIAGFIEQNEKIISLREKWKEQFVVIIKQ